jgi:hypothetical protein
MFSTKLAARTIIIFGFGLLVSSPALARDEVQVCHVPNGNPENAHDISISEKAAEAHLRNHEGDMLGACPEAVACQCWGEKGLNFLLEALAARPDVMIESCGMAVFPAYSELFANLSLAAEFGYALGYVYGDEDEASCFVIVDNIGLGIVPIEEKDISVEEAGECARLIGEFCSGLLP